MKTLSSFLLLMVLSLCNPWSGFGYEPLPVWYRQFLDEDRCLYRSGVVASRVSDRDDSGPRPEVPKERTADTESALVQLIEREMATNQ